MNSIDALYGRYKIRTVEDRLFPPSRGPGGGRPRDPEKEDQALFLAGICAYGVVVDPKGRRPITPAEAYWLAAAVETAAVYLEPCSILADTRLDDRARQRAKTIKQRARRIRKRWRQEQRSPIPYTLNRVRELVRAGLKDPDR